MKCIRIIDVFVSRRNDPALVPVKQRKRLVANRLLIQLGTNHSFSILLTLQVPDVQMEKKNLKFSTETCTIQSKSLSMRVHTQPNSRTPLWHLTVLLKNDRSRMCRVKRSVCMQHVMIEITPSRRSDLFIFDTPSATRAKSFHSSRYVTYASVSCSTLS